MPQRRRIAQLPWGGGTPNHLTTAEATTLWRLLEPHFSLDEALERRQLIREVMCHFQTRFDPRRYPVGWEHLHTLAADGLLRLEAKDGLAVLEVSRGGRWRRTIRACWQPVRGPGAVSVL